jgi:hypothetical protein
MVRAEEKLARLREEGDWYRHGHGTSISTLTAEIDALAALGYRELVEREAPALLHRGTYGEPFAWRALGLVREDWELIRRALRASRSSASIGTLPRPVGSSEISRRSRGATEERQSGRCCPCSA